MAREITLQERAALYYHLSARCNDWQQLYRIAKGDNALSELINDETRASTVSRWKKSEAIQTALKEIRCILDMERTETEARAVEEYKKQPEESQELTETNFLNLEEFLDYANSMANKIKDEKEQRAWVEMIGKYMNFRETEENAENERRHFFTPMECAKCPIYHKCKDCTLSPCPKLTDE